METNVIVCQPKVITTTAAVSVSVARVCVCIFMFHRSVHKILRISFVRQNDGWILHRSTIWIFIDSHHHRRVDERRIQMSIFHSSSIHILIIAAENAID